MATEKFGNIARTDLVVHRDETDSTTPPVDKGDINATGAGASKILAINSGNTGLEWIAQAGSADSLAALTDTNITTPADGAVIVYDTGTSKWRDQVISGDATMDDAGVLSIADNVIDGNHLAATASGSLGRRIMCCTVTATAGAEAANKIEVSYGFVDMEGVAIDFSASPVMTVPNLRVIVSDSLNGPKNSSAAYVSDVTQGTVIDGLNTAECIIKGSEVSSGTHIKFKVFWGGVGPKYIWVGTPDCASCLILQAAIAPQIITFA